MDVVSDGMDADDIEMKRKTTWPYIIRGDLQLNWYFSIQASMLSLFYARVLCITCDMSFLTGAW